MAKRIMNPKVRQILMQSLLVLVFAAAVGLAALVTRHVRMSMRVELGEQKTIGRLVVRLPLKWLSSPVTLEKGEGVEVEEPPSETAPVRRLRIMRQKSDGFAPPLEHLFRSGQIKADTLKGLAEGREGYSISNLSIGGWPGQMLTMMSSPRAGVVHKDVLACAMMPGSQALVIALEGLGPLDASDKELVRQMSENVSLAMQAPPPDAGGTVELSDQITVAAPSRYLVVPHGDVNELQRHLIFDGSRGSAWLAIDLVSCVFFADDGDETFLTMLAARDPEWRSGAAVKRLGARTLMSERVDSSSHPAQFASRAYLTANGDSRALLVVIRAGNQDQRAMESAWQTIASSLKFAGTKDLSSLLVNGAQGARELSAGLLDELDEDPRSEDWSMWDDSENADKELWSQVKWQLTRKAGESDMIAGSRTSKPTNPYANDTAYEQQWSAAAGDLSKYQVTTYREVRRAGNQLPRQTIEQRVSLNDGRITMSSQLRPEPVELAAPAQYVPGALLPLVVRQLAERPSLIRTESFVGAQTLAPPALLTLFVTRLTDSPVRLDEKGEPMDCVSVSVNGTGVVSRWYYGSDDALKFIDFAGNMKAQAQPGKK
jgi:hypothetical protein